MHDQVRLRAEGTHLYAEPGSGRAFAYTDTFAAMCQFSGKELRANTERLAMCWNEHDELVAEVTRLKGQLEERKAA